MALTTEVTSSSTISSSSHKSHYLPSHHLSTRSSSSFSSFPDSSLATPPRLSMNSNLMNYSIPKNDQATESPLQSHSNSNNDRREIQQGNSDTRTRQLEAQIEALTLSNVRLQRSNRLLKVDTDNLIEQKTQPLQTTIRELTFNNVQLQRSTRLLQQDLKEKTDRLNHFQTDQVLAMKTVGPEYEYLVQMINLLHRQINGDANCEEICCYTSAPVDQSTVVMTLPPENEDNDDQEHQQQQQGIEAQHICRPIIHSSISQGSYAAELERKITQLEQVIYELENEKEVILRQQSYKDDDIQMLKKELQIKDDIVSQLEQDFIDLEDKLAVMQNDLDQRDPAESSSYSNYHHHHQSPSPPPDPRRQSQMLMESKRRSLAIKDTDLLEKMLRGDLDLENRNDIVPPSPTASSASSFDQQQQSDDDDDDDDDDVNDNKKVDHGKDRELHEPSPSAENTPQTATLFLSGTSIPCRYHPSPQPNSPLVSPITPAVFTLMTFFLGLRRRRRTNERTDGRTITLPSSQHLMTYLDCYFVFDNRSATTMTTTMTTTITTMTARPLLYITK
ncbi:hypothetical protein [Absidia glauca]|uniref:Uncharacterized protein n=1 Tax=Absidia glauca TaxID=4829 RepID=A0A163J673_ABSGL|nr:hypothetical protein [Absidia glauca]